MPFVQIGNNWEEIFRQYEIRDTNGTVIDVALPPAEITNLVVAINQSNHGRKTNASIGHCL